MALLLRLKVRGLLFYVIVLVYILKIALVTFANKTSLNLILINKSYLYATLKLLLIFLKFLYYLAII